MTKGKSEITETYHQRDSRRNAAPECANHSQEVRPEHAFVYMMVWADAIGAENQERKGEHEAESHPHSLIADSQQVKTQSITRRLTFSSWNPVRRTTVALSTP